MSSYFPRDQMITGPGSQSHNQSEYYTLSGDPTVYGPRFTENVLWDMNRSFSQGYDIPNFHRRKNAGELLPYTPWYQERSFCSHSGSLSYEHTGYSTHWWDTDSGNDFIAIKSKYPIVSTAPLLDDFIESKGIDPLVFVQGAAASIYSRGWDALTFFAEFQHIIRMFRNIIQNVMKYGSLRELYNAWLEGRYGWRILVFDIQDIMKLIAKLDEEERTRVKERTGTSVSDTISTSLSQNRGIGMLYADLTEVYDLSVRGSVIADYTPPDVTFNPVLTAWELVPFSFVIDWILTIGNAINAISLAMLSNKYFACYGYEFKYSLSISATSSTWSSGWTGTYEQETTQQVSITKRVPCSVPYFPRIDLNLDAFKVGDLLALLMQWLSKP